MLRLRYGGAVNSHRDWMGIHRELGYLEWEGTGELGGGGHSIAAFIGFKLMAGGAVKALERSSSSGGETVSCVLTVMQHGNAVKGAYSVILSKVCSQTREEKREYRVGAQRARAAYTVQTLPYLYDSPSVSS